LDVGLDTAVDIKYSWNARDELNLGEINWELRVNGQYVGQLSRLGYGRWNIYACDLSITGSAYGSLEHAADNLLTAARSKYGE
jgi:hypothetical protein